MVALNGSDGISLNLAFEGHSFVDGCHTGNTSLIHLIKGSNFVKILVINQLVCSNLRELLYYFHLCFKMLFVLRCKRSR